MPAGGESMALIQDILPASQIVTGMMEAARELLEHSTTRVDEN